MSRINRLAVLVTLLAASASLAASVETTVPLEYVRGEGCVFDARGATALRDVPAPNADGLIVIEAETPLRYFCDPRYRHEGAPMPTNPEASAGGYIEDVVTAQYRFHADRAGDHWLWMRVATPKGTSRVRDIVNGGMWYFLEEKGNEEPQGWHWVFRRKVALREGINHLALTEFHAAFPKVDQVLFSPLEEYTPEGVFEETRTLPGVAWVETAPVTVPGLVELVGVTGLPAQAIAVEVAFGDGGRETVPHDPAARTADLGGLEGEGALRMRVTLEGGGEADPGKIALAARVDPRQFVDISDGQTRCVFDADTGGLFLMEDLSAGRAVCCPATPRPLVSVDLKRQGEAEWTRFGPESVTQVLWKEDQRKRWVQDPQGPEPAQVRPIFCEGDAEHFKATFNFGREGLGKVEVTYLI